mgnify:CR=1 FL=1
MKKRLFSLAVLSALLLQLLSGCAAGVQESTPPSVEPTQPPATQPAETDPPAPSVQPGPITVTDQAGREVTLDAPAEKIVSCYYLVTASLLTLGQKDKIVGIEMKADSRELYKLAAPEFLELPGVGSGKETNIEAIAALEPDLVLLPKKQLEAAETLAGLGIPTAVVEPETYEAFNGLIELLGVLCGCGDKAAALTAYYDGVVQRVTALTAEAEKPSVYLCGEASWLRACAGGMYQRELIEMAGGTCVSAELPGAKWADISAEQLAAWNPEVIFSVSYAEYSLDDIRNDAALSGLEAVTADRLYTVPSEIEAWDYPQPSSILGLLWMAHILHPELVSEEEYVKEAQEFYQTYFGLEVSKEQLGV